MFNLPENMPQDIKDVYNRNKDVIHITSVPPIPRELEDGPANKITQWIMHQSGLPTILLDVEVPHDEMLKEALSNNHRFVKHRGGDSPGWSSMAVHGTAVEDTSPREALIAQGKYTEENAPDYHWTELADSCPVTKEWVESLGFSLLKRVRFMKLDPGGWIVPHRDTDVPGLQAWNISINNPDGHIFCQDKFGYIPWQPGEMRGIDISKLHTVVNTSSKPRIHMIIHGHHDTKFNETIIRSYKKIYNEFNS
jgi:hypothetical protein